MRRVRRNIASKKTGAQAISASLLGRNPGKSICCRPSASCGGRRRTAMISKLSRMTLSRAALGVRSCELHAIAIQDRVLMGGKHVDRYYKAQRENILLVAVNCTRAGETCFCASMGTGPKVEKGFDLSLTEIVEKKEHYFIVEIGSRAGEAVLQELKSEEARAEEIEKAEKRLQHTAKHMGRTLESAGLREVLYENAESQHWQKVGQRCLSCANCTMVCPTCFCTTVEDVTDLTGTTAERRQLWDSCFSLDYSYIHGGSVRRSAEARYRQWITHKLASWIDQFGTSGCVGCGRCITWCPAGIDITEEIKVLQGESRHEQNGRKVRRVNDGINGKVSVRAPVLE